jgi:uncharacterized protein YndB with AHSA1/START domain
MKWVMIGLGVLGALIALITLVGFMLPREHIATRSRTIERSVSDVWSLLSTLDGYTGWHPGVTAVERLPERNGHAVWRETAKDGVLTYELVEMRAPQRMVTRIVDEPHFGGTWTYELKPVAKGTEVTITERGEIYNPVFRTLSRFVFGYTDSMDKYLDALQQQR